jgi:hypothetical protein
MNVIETVSVLAGSVILLGLFLSAAYEGLITKRNSKMSVVSAFDDKWHKLTVSTR